jgi:hypothetical protein
MLKTVFKCFFENRLAPLQHGRGLRAHATGAARGAGQGRALRRGTVRGVGRLHHGRRRVVLARLYGRVFHSSANLLEH